MDAKTRDTSETAPRGAALPQELVHLLRLAYSAERAAAFAYRGHARSVRDPREAAEIEAIEREEWLHRDLVLGIMTEWETAPSRLLEVKYAILGRLLGWSCHLIGWFLPMYFAGRLESGNVNEYVAMQRLFNGVGVAEHDACLHEMAQVEKEHELYFLEKVRGHPWLPLFAKLFRWGPDRSFNDLPLRSRPLERD